MLNNVLVSYENSKLSWFLEAPFNSSDFEQWTAFGQTLEYLDQLLRVNDKITFYSQQKLDFFFIEDCFDKDKHYLFEDLEEVQQRIIPK